LRKNKSIHIIVIPALSRNLSIIIIKIRTETLNQVQGDLKKLVIKKPAWYHAGFFVLETVSYL